MPDAKGYPQVGEHWERADGSKDGVTITAVDFQTDPSHPWVHYRYDSGQENEKQWLAFYCRFFFQEKT